MTDAILVLNAGSSSIKFSVFVAAKGELGLAFSAQVEGLFNSPHFISKTTDGALLGEKSWGYGTKLGHARALGHRRAVLRVHCLGAAETRTKCRDGEDGRHAPGEWLEYVCHERRPKYGLHHGLFCSRWSANGHPLWCARSRRDPLSAGSP